MLAPAEGSVIENNLGRCFSGARGTPNARWRSQFFLPYRPKKKGTLRVAPGHKETRRPSTRSLLLARVARDSSNERNGDSRLTNALNYPGRNPSLIIRRQDGTRRTDGTVVTTELETADGFSARKRGVANHIHERTSRDDTSSPDRSGHRI